MKPILELLILFLEYYKKDPQVGMCNSLRFMETTLIKEKDKERFSVYLRKNKPSETLHSDFYLPDRKGRSFWWPLDKEYRINFLEHLIKVESNNMSREDAFAYSKSRGVSLTHTYFSEKEFIRIIGNMVFTKEGYSISVNEFMAYRKGDSWETNWKIFNDV